MERKKAVGLVVLTRINGGPLKAVLQVRGKFNHEKMGPESFPGACQVTVHGGLEKDETFKDALLRETRQEVGNNANRLLEKNIKNLREVARVETPKKLVVTYGAILPPDFLAKMKLNVSTGGIRLVGHKELDNLIELTDKEKTAGVPDDLVAMFPDEIEAVRKAFEVLQPALEIAEQPAEQTPQPMVAVAAQ